MSLPCPQRDALEAIMTVKQKARLWSDEKATQLNSRLHFELPSGKTIHLVGVNRGAGARKNPNLHFAVFSDKPRRGRLQTQGLLKKCRFGALVTQGKDGWLVIRGLTFVGILSDAITLRPTRHSERYRQTIC